MQIKVPNKLSATTLGALLVVGLGSAPCWAGDAINLFPTGRTDHGGGPFTGSPNVLLGGTPITRVGDGTTCPLSCSDTEGHGGGIVLNGSSTVLINGQQAAVGGVSRVRENGCNATTTLVSGLPTVQIGS